MGRTQVSSTKILVLLLWSIAIRRSTSISYVSATKNQFFTPRLLWIPLGFVPNLYGHGIRQSHLQLHLDWNCEEQSCKQLPWDAVCCIAFNHQSHFHQNPSSIMTINDFKEAETTTTSTERRVARINTISSVISRGWIAWLQWSKEFIWRTVTDIQNHSITYPTSSRVWHGVLICVSHWTWQAWHLLFWALDIGPGGYLLSEEKHWYQIGNRLRLVELARLMLEATTTSRSVLRRRCDFIRPSLRVCKSRLESWTWQNGSREASWRGVAAYHQLSDWWGSLVALLFPRGRSARPLAYCAHAATGTRWQVLVASSHQWLRQRTGLDRHH